MDGNSLNIPGLFITGNDTGVGKTQVGAAVARALVSQGVRVGVYKPVESGWISGQEGDAERLWNAAGRPRKLDDVCPQRFATPVAPHLAARLESSEVDAQQLRQGACDWSEHCDFLIVEGAGGLMSPLTDDEFVADVAYDLGLPLLVVVANKIGVISQTLQTLITASTFRQGLHVAGIVMNHVEQDASDPSLPSNRSELEARCVPPVVAELSFGANSFEASIDWMQLAKGV